MTGTVHRFVAASASVAAPPADPFGPMGFVVFEIDEALGKAGDQTAALRAAIDAKALDGMAAAQAELDKLLAQSKLLSESLGRVIQFHRNRAKAMP